MRHAVCSKTVKGLILHRLAQCMDSASAERERQVNYNIANGFSKYKKIPCVATNKPGEPGVSTTSMASVERRPTMLIVGGYQELEVVDLDGRSCSPIASFPLSIVYEHFYGFVKDEVIPIYSIVYPQ